MSVKKEPSGRRSVQVQVEVPGTPEAVWAAIASGKGISAWFVPTKLDENVGGSVAHDFGGGMASTAKITEWQPPHRFAAEDHWLQNGPPIATEWTVEATDGGTCIVRVVHSLFASTDDWDGQLEGTENGWPGYFRVLRHYLQNHAGQAAASFTLMTPSSDGAPETWLKIAKAIGIPNPQAGLAVRADLGGGVTVAGTVHAVDHTDQYHGAMMLVKKPVPGVVLASGMDCMGMKMATLQAFFYGPEAEAAAAAKEHWEKWLLAIFPPPSDAPPAS